MLSHILLKEAESFPKNRTETIMAVFYNQANLSYSGGSTSSNIVSGEILEVLSATKTVVDATYSPGETVTYVVSILNSGTTPISDLTLTDDLGEYTVGGVSFVPLTYDADTLNYYVNGVLQPVPAVIAQQPLTVGGISVPAGGNAIIIYSATANEAAPPVSGASVVNTVTITGTGLTAPVTATATVNAASEPALTISKGISPATVTENSRITYTFTIRNSGNREASADDNIVVTDTFDPILENITVAVNGDTVTEGYTYDEATGLFTTNAGFITVPAAEYVQDPTTGEWTVTPGTTVITVVGTV